MKRVKFSDIDITGGFWKTKQDMVKNITVDAVYDRFSDTHRFDALKCEWKDGELNQPHIFWDSDVAKWIEGVSYILKKERNERPDNIIDESVDLIVKNSDENGYYNSHFLVTRQDERFHHRGDHELYCLGHLIEAAVAYYDATGKDKLLKAMCKYTDYVEKVFMIDKSAKFFTPGHPELELALVKLYDTTGEERYLKLAEYFIDEHGKHIEDIETFYNGVINLYNQDDMPVKDRTTIDGHSVRAFYLYCAVADIARKTGNQELFNACKRVFENAANKRMYITGGVGSTRHGEAFTVDYDLPNRTAYAETCASVSFAMFAGRMLEIEANSAYADIVERQIYNGILSGVSLDGKSFFYENPLEIDLEYNDVNKSTQSGDRYPITQRVEVFDCSCCPPNIVRFIPSVADYMYTYDDETVYVHQYMDSKMSNGEFCVAQTTRYPENGKVSITCDLGERKLALRIPSWCKKFTINCDYEMKNGYAIVDDGNKIELEFDMPVVLLKANRKVHENAGRVAVMRGPVVYCAEAIDNIRDLKSVYIDRNSDFTVENSEFLVPTITANAYIEAESDKLYTDEERLENIKLKLIPYYAFANRGETSMLVWLLKN